MRRFENEREIQMEMEKYFSGIEFGKLVDDYFGDDDAHWLKNLGGMIWQKP